MNYFEFLNILKSDPYCKDPDFIDARKTDSRCRIAYEKAMKQEQILQDALNISVPKHNIEHIRFSQAQQQLRTSKNIYFAAAASLALLFGAAVFMFSLDKGTDLENFINEALVMEPAVYMSDNEIPQDELKPLFASINTAIDGDLGQVHFMKLCPTLNGKGARMVVMNELNQPITVLYMPNSPVEEAIDMQMDDLKGKIVALEQGSAAIIAQPHESTALVEHNLRAALKPVQ